MEGRFQAQEDRDEKMFEMDGAYYTTDRQIWIPNDSKPKGYFVDAIIRRILGWALHVFQFTRKQQQIYRHIHCHAVPVEDLLMPRWSHFLHFNQVETRAALCVRSERLTLTYNMDVKMSGAFNR